MCWTLARVPIESSMAMTTCKVRSYCSSEIGTTSSLEAGAAAGDVKHAMAMGVSKLKVISSSAFTCDVPRAGRRGGRELPCLGGRGLNGSGRAMGAHRKRCETREARAWRMRARRARRGRWGRASRGEGGHHVRERGCRMGRGGGGGFLWAGAGDNAPCTVSSQFGGARQRDVTRAR